ncbi:MAG: glycosyl transferase family 2, partial [Microbacteriaceae bacterium]|nr:glycosyl transferase family 2 [Microbacteriaceae bacterium]
TRRAVADYVHGARIVDVPVNIGYGGGCNLGVQNAAGSLIFLLNDDAIVDPHALARLATRATREPEVAAVGAVLLNPDGTLQEAGSRVLRDAGTVQLGAGLDPVSAEARPFLVHRDVDYASGAALLIKREAFDAVGGFDPIYEPAYFEDVDLAFRLKASGWRVVLEPSAWATHASGSSTAADTRFRTFAADHSGRAFRARWAEVLESAPDRDAGVAVVCVIPRSAEDQLEPRQREPLATALAISGDYASWLAARLDARESELDAREAELADANSHLETARVEALKLQERIDSLNEAAHALKLRVDEADRKIAEFESLDTIGAVKLKLKTRSERKN